MSIHKHRKPMPKKKHRIGWSPFWDDSKAPPEERPGRHGRHFKPGCKQGVHRWRNAAAKWTLQCKRCGFTKSTGYVGEVRVIRPNP